MINLIINNKPIDTFDNESISVTSKDKDFSDLSKIYASFSTEFTLPASDNNNEVFQNYWDFNIQEVNVMNLNYIDYRIKQRCSLGVDGVPYKEGYIKLNSIDLHDNKPIQYRCVFYDNLVQLSDRIGDDLVKDLDWQDLNHEVGNPAAVQIGLTATTSLYGDKLIYPLVTNNKEEWTSKRLLNGVIYTDDAFHDDRMIKSEELSPALQVYEIWKRIQSEHGITFNAPMFETTWFKKLYLWCPVRPTEEDLKDVSEYGVQFNGEYFLYYEPEPVDRWDRVESTITITPDASVATESYTVRPVYRENYEGAPFNKIDSNVYTGTGTQTFTFTKSSNPSEYVIGYFLEPLNSIDFPFTYNVNTKFIQNPSTVLEQFNSNGSETFVTISNDFSRSIPDIKQIDIINTLIRLYNLVIIPNDDGTLDVMTYDTWVNSGKVIDVTDKLDIDKSTIQVNPLPKQVLFEWKDPKAENNKKFKELTSEGYGDEHLETGGEDADYEVKISEFENLLWDRLTPSTDNLYIGKAISGGTNPSLSGMNDPFLMFWSATATPPSPIKLQRQSTTWNEISSYKLCDSYYPTADPTTAITTLNFGAELNAYTTKAEQVNLIDLYYSKTMHTLLDKNIRKFIVSGVIEFPYNTQIRLNDVLKIYDNYYRIEELTANILTGGMDFILHNVERKPSIIVPFTDDTEKPLISRLSLVSTDFTTADLSWLPATDNVGVTNYDIYVDNIYNKTVGNVTTAQVTGLKDNTEYKFTIKAKDAAGNVSWVSNEVVGKTKLIDNDPPIIGVLMCGKYEHDKINIGWTKATDAGVGVSHYDIYKDGTKVDTVQKDVLQWTDQPLAAGEDHSYKIKAIDNYGNESDFSNEIHCSTEDTIPPTISNFKVLGVYGAGFEMDVDDNVDVVKAEVWMDDVLTYTLTTQHSRTAEFHEKPISKGNIFIKAPWGSSDNVNFAPGVTHTWKAKVYDEAGNESQFSNEETFTHPQRYAVKFNGIFNTSAEACEEPQTTTAYVYNDLRGIGFSVGDYIYDWNLLTVENLKNTYGDYTKVWYGGLHATLGNTESQIIRSDRIHPSVHLSSTKVTEVITTCSQSVKIDAFHSCRYNQRIIAYSDTASTNIGERMWKDENKMILLDRDSISNLVGTYIELNENSIVKAKSLCVKDIHDMVHTPSDTVAEADQLSNFENTKFIHWDNTIGDGTRVYNMNETAFNGNDKYYKFKTYTVTKILKIDSQGYVTEAH